MSRPSIFKPARKAGGWAKAVDAAAPAAVPAKPARNKFGAKKCACHAGHGHASKAEARRCNELALLQRAGTIRELRQQPQFWFVIDGRQVKHEGGRRVGYKADFAYFEGETHVVEDVKGNYRDDAWTLRKAIFRALFPDIVLREVA